MYLKKSPSIFEKKLILLAQELQCQLPLAKLLPFLYPTELEGYEYVGTKVKQIPHPQHFLQG